MANLKDTIVLGDLTATGTIAASRIESSNKELYIGKNVNAEESSEIRLFSSASDLGSYATLYGAVEDVATSTWTKVATVGLYGAVIVIGATYSPNGGFAAIASGNTLHVHYKSGCVTNVRVTSDRELQVYTNNNAKKMRILCMKVYD